MTPPPMHQGRCLGWTLKDTPKEAKLHGRQCPLRASFRLSFLGFTLTRPKRGSGYFSSPFHAGNLSLGIAAVSPASQPNAQIIAKPPRRNQARRFAMFIRLANNYKKSARFGGGCIGSIGSVAAKALSFSYSTGTSFCSISQMVS